MADRIVMGYWDCKYCGTDGIEGTRRDCPNCGHPRDKDVKFYMKSRTHEEVAANNEYLSEKQAATKGKGADWECSFCGALNSVLSTSCKSCGHPREESDLNYFQMRAREDGQNSGTAESVYTPGYGTGRDDSDSSGISFGKTKLKAKIRQGPLWKKILRWLIFLLAVAFAAGYFTDHLGFMGIHRKAKEAPATEQVTEAPQTPEVAEAPEAE